MKNLYTISFILIISFALWSTSPSKVVPTCEEIKVNTTEMCNILNAE